MLELRCKTTPAVTARHIVRVLYRDARLLWLSEADGVQNYDVETIRNHFNFLGRLEPSLKDDVDRVRLGVFRDQTSIGVIDVLTHDSGSLVLASHLATVDSAYAPRTVTDDITDITPVFDAITVELARLGVLVGQSGKPLPPVKDPFDLDILKWVTRDPDLTDQEIGQRLGIGRQAANVRRRTLEKMGYTVR